MIKRPDMYLLAADGETPVPVTDAVAWARRRTTESGAFSEYGRVGNWFGVNAANERVQVSTIFLGMDHDWTFRGPPVLWETMLFGCAEGSKLDQYCVRYTSAKAAKRGHHWYVWLMTQRLGFVETAEDVE